MWLTGVVFFPRDAMQALPMPSCGVCPSVSPSVTFVNSVKTNKHIFKLMSPSSSQTILFFPYKTSRQYSDGIPNGGVECRWGRQKSQLWTNGWLSINHYWTCKQLRRTTVQFIAQTATHQWIFVYHSLQHGRIRRIEENRTEFNCTQR